MMIRKMTWQMLIAIIEKITKLRRKPTNQKSAHSSII